MRPLLPGSVGGTIRIWMELLSFSLSPHPHSAQLLQSECPGTHRRYGWQVHGLQGIWLSLLRLLGPLEERSPFIISL